MWIVRFIRKDAKPDEEYFYHSQGEAEYHRDLFQNDDSGLYEKIEVINETELEGGCYGTEFYKVRRLLHS